MKKIAQRQSDIFAANLKSSCSERGDITRLADSANLSRVFVSKIINRRAVPTLDVAARIAHSLGFSLAEMLAKKTSRKYTQAG
jgi:DNA-binding phage protein